MAHSSERAVTTRYYDGHRDYYHCHPDYLICRVKHDHHRDCYRPSSGPSNYIVNYGNLYIDDHNHARPHYADRVAYVRVPARESEYYRVSETSVCVSRSRSSSRARSCRGSCRGCSSHCDLWDGAYCRSCYYNCLTVRTPRDTIRICDRERDRPWADSRRVISYR